MLQDVHSRRLSRRSFLVTTGAFSVAVTFGSRIEPADAAQDFAPNAWVTIADDGWITIVPPAVEMGQGVRTSLPLILAEDLDADWSKVRLAATPDNDKIYGNPIFQNQLTTVGSLAVAGYYEKLRLAGAQARAVLLANAADAWKVPVAELTTQPSEVVHSKSGRRISYGDLAKTAKVPDPLPQVTAANLKPSSQFRLIGKDVPRLDTPGKVTGLAAYGIDTQLPDMLYAAILYPPVQYQKPEQIDDTAAKAVKGVVKIVPLPAGVGVIAENLPAARKAKEALKVTWSKATAQTYNNEAILHDYQTLAADWNKPGVEMLSKGDVAAAFNGAAKVLKADYFSEHVSHVCMEPLNATVRVDGDRVETWSGNQSPTTMKILGSIAAGTTPDKVTVHTAYLGGGFGRKTDGDELFQTTLLAKAVSPRAVKMIWSREDDIMNDKFRPLTAQRVEIALDANNNIVGWRHRIVNESYFARIMPPDLFAKIKKDIVSGGGGDMTYAVPNHLVEWVRDPRGVDVGAWRGIAAGYTKFAIETLVDEIAALKGVDPVAYRLAMLKDSPRAAAVVQAVADMSDINRKRPGRAVGIAYNDALHSHTAGAAEVSVDDATGKIMVHHLWAAVDAGIAVQPKNIVAQIESAMTFGLGAALIEQITVKDGVVQETNFDQYQVVRMSDMPPMEVRVIATDNPPSGIGEAGVPVVAPAIANAVAQLTGKRLRHLPMTPDRVKRGLA
jgi:isoquinoline 1-oxidoreductase beta subunit